MKILIAVAMLATMCAAQGITEFSLPANANAGNLCAQDTTLIWFTDDPNNAIGQMDASGNVYEYVLPTAHAGPVGCAFGPDGRLYFAEQLVYKIGAFDPVSTTFTEWRVPAPNRNIAGVAFDAAGVLNIMVAGSSAIHRMQIDGTFLAPIQLPLGRYPHGPSLCAGNIWFAEYTANRVAVLDLSGLVTEFLLPQANSKPFQTACATDGLYFTESNVARVGRIDPTTLAISQWNTLSLNSQPQGITAGYDGNLWLAEGNSNKLTVMLPGGTAMIEYPVPTAKAWPNKLSPCFGSSCMFQRA